METAVVLQGRRLGEQELREVRELICGHPDWNRKRLAIELARAWNWRTLTGRVKDMAAFSLLLKLDGRGWITLPPRRRPATKRMPLVAQRLLPLELECPLKAELGEVTPVVIELVAANHPRFRRYLAEEHYLGYGGPVGEHLAYLIRGRSGRALACVLFGAAAWKVAPRDHFIGWDPAVRAQRLSFLTNNTRFLIRPFVKIAHLASHILGRITRRLSADWQAKYGHPVYLIETFVQKERFPGTSYKAAGWTYVGDTQGRGRGDRTHTKQGPIKGIWVKPLCHDFRERLCGGVGR